MNFLGFTHGMECPFRTYFEPIVCGSHFPNAGTVTSTGGAQIPRGAPGRYRECGALYDALCTARPLPTVCRRQVAAGYNVVAMCQRWHSNGRAWRLGRS